jgi:molybdopterin synthase sulfur carrier subunit
MGVSDEDLERARNILVRVPRVLAELTGCERRLHVAGTTVAEALTDLVRQRPAIRIHLFDDTGELRRHVLCFRNQVAVEQRTELSDRVAPGDELTLMNSVAGG